MRPSNARRTLTTHFAGRTNGDVKKGIVDGARAARPPSDQCIQTSAAPVLLCLASYQQAAHYLSFCRTVNLKRYFTKAAGEVVAGAVNKATSMPTLPGAGMEAEGYSGGHRRLCREIAVARC